MECFITSGCVCYMGLALPLRSKSGWMEVRVNGQPSCASVRGYLFFVVHDRSMALCLAIGVALQCRHLLLYNSPYLVARSLCGVALVSPLNTVYDTLCVQSACSPPSISITSDMLPISEEYCVDSYQLVAGLGRPYNRCCTLATTQWSRSCALL